jgi:cysteine desulfurase
VIHLDAAATSPVRREVLEAVMPLFTQTFGNPASHHEAGEAAQRALEWGRGLLAEACGVRPGRVVFTSGGTESNALALHGTALARPRGRHVLVSALEHPSVVRAAEQLAAWHGFEVQTVPVGRSGVVDPADVAALLRPDTTLVALMAVNNEVGTVQPVEAVAALVREAGARLHVDAVQAGSWLPLAPLAAAAHTLSVSGHKLGGLKGAGALVLGRGVALAPFLDGGGQEDGMRSGTVNVPGAVATGLAVRLAQHDVAAYLAGEAPCRAGPGQALAAAVLGGLAAAGVPAELTGDAAERVPGVVSFVFPGVHAESVLLELGRRGVLASSGSACAAGSSDPSEVLTAMGYPAEVAVGALRLSFGPRTPATELEAAAGAVVESVLAVHGRGVRA